MAATFSFQTTGQATLQLQLLSLPVGGTSGGTSGSPETARVTHVFASGESTAGTAYHPIVSRPSSTGTALVSSYGVPVNFSHISSGGLDPFSFFAVATAWSVAPSLPTLTDQVQNLPFIMESALPRGSELVLTGIGSLLLYATSGGGHTWSGGFVWEEV